MTRTLVASVCVEITTEEPPESACDAISEKSRAMNDSQKHKYIACSPIEVGVKLQLAPENGHSTIYGCPCRRDVHSNDTRHPVFALSTVLVPPSISSIIIIIIIIYQYVAVEKITSVGTETQSYCLRCRIDLVVFALGEVDCETG